MKKIILYLGLLSSFLMISNQVDATHVMGGEVTWVCNAQGEYIFTFKTYRDCSGAATGGPNNSWRIQNYPNIGQTLTLTENTSQRVDGEIGPNCRIGSPGFQSYSCVAGDPEVVFEYVRVMNPVRLNGTPPPAGWIVTYTQAARNANNNLLGATTPNAHDITLRAKIFPHSGSVANQCIDNSPQFREKATSLICRGSSFTYNHNATDDELDSLVYEWTSPLDGFTGAYNEGVNPAFIAFEPGFSFNNPFPGPESLNSATGEITVNSPTAGKYVSAVRVSAYKCGEKVAEIVRELQSVISGNCSVTQTKPTIDPPFPDGSGGFRYNDTVRAGDLVTFALAARDVASLNLTTIPPYLGDSVFLSATGQQFGTNFTSTTGCLNPPCATLSTPLPAKGLLGVTTTFNWQTDCNHVSFTDRCISGQNTYTFVITATDDECPIPALNISTISITVVGDTVIESPDVNCVDVAANGDVTLDWNLTPNINNSFTGWMIYSATDRNGPFVLLDSVKTYSTSTYTHVGANANNQQMHYVVRSRSGCKGIVQNIAKDTISTLFVQATTNPTNVAVNWNAISNPNPAGSAAQYRVFREYPIGTGFNLYQSTANTSLTETLTPCTDDVRYRVELVNSANGCTSSSNILNYNFKFPDPQTNFSFPNNQCPNTPISFTNLTTITGGPVTYSWNFGDGSALSTATSPSHTYTAPGNYTVELTAISGQGCDSVFSQTISITLPNADAGADQAICPGGTASIGASPVAGLTYSWSPTTGLSNANIANPTASPATTTPYTLTVTDANGCTNTDQVTITVIPFPTADAGGAQAICLGANTTLGGSPTGPPGATYAWSSNPAGFTSTAANPVVSPTVNTTYTVTVTIGSGTTCADTDNALVSVLIPPTADAGADQDICPGTSVQIGVAPSAGFTYSWTPTAGLSNTNIANPIATPVSPTTYTVQITETATGCVNTDAMNITFNAVPTPTFTVSNTCINQITAFTDASTIATGSITAWAWDFDDAGATSTVQNPTHQFSAAGTYQVKLVVTSNLGCNDSITTPITIDPKPTVDFTFANLCLNDATQFTDGSTIGTGSVNTWRWDFDGLGSSTLQNPTFTFPTAGTYDVKLVSGSGAGCLDSITKQVIINPLPTADAGTDQDICPGTSVQIGVAPSAGFTYSWTPTAGLSNTNIANPIATPVSPTTYTVQITETATGCVNTDAMNITFNAVPTPTFTVSNTCINQITAFTDASTIATGSITAWAWDFDDAGATSTLQNPTHQFSAAGTYQVKLVVTSDFGCKDSITTPITIDPKPTVDFTFANLCLNDATQFTDGSTIGSGSVNTWRWDFDGLGSSTLQNPTFTFPTAGTYDVKLVSGSGAGCLDSITKQVIINPLPTADAGTDQDICPGTSVQIGVAPSAGFTYSWTPTAGLSNTNIANPIATPVSPTTYTVQITETATGCVNTDAMNITFNAVPTPTFTVSNTCINQITAFTDASTIATGSITAWAWDFDDAGATSTLQNPTHQFSAAGTYQVKLVVTSNLGCKDSITTPITIDPKPTVDFTFANLCLNDATQFTDGSTIGSGSVNTWRWDFDGFGSSTLQNPTFTFPAAGTYDVKLVSGSGAGCLDSITKQVIINPLPTADAGTDQDICNTFSVQIGGSPTSSTPNVSYAWDNAASLNDNTLANPTASPSVTTRYSLTVTENTTGCFDTSSILIRVNPIPVVDFSIADTCIGNTTIFTDNTTLLSGTISSWSWDFGDGVGTSTQPSPVYTYAAVGTYNVKLVVETAIGCKDSITKTITVVALPNVDAGADQVICDRDTVTIGGAPTSNTAGVTYLWDNSASLNDATLANPLAFPSTTTRYKVTVTETLTGCTDTASVVINVNPVPVAAFTATAVCENELTQFTDGSTIPSGAITSWVWDFGDGVGTSTQQNPSYQYTAAGTYQVKLVVESAFGCKDSISNSITISPKPTPLFTFVNLCENDVTQFTDASTIATGSITSWSWDFGDGVGTSNVQNPSYTFTAPNTYNVKLVLVSDFGCTDSITLPVTINPLPLVDAGSDQVICNTGSVQIGGSPTSGTPNVSYTWDNAGSLNDNTLANPTATPTVTTRYSLTVTENTTGCFDTASVLVTVNPIPVVDFSVADICVGNTTLFTDLSSLSVGTISSWTWDFGDGVGTSIQQNPSYTYANTGTYSVKLIVQSAVGCRDSITKAITITSLPNIDAGTDQGICLNDSVTIGGAPTSTGTNVSYAWDNGATLDDNSIANPTAKPSVTTRYSLTVTDLNTGCSDTSSVVIRVNPLPNANFRASQVCTNVPTQFTDLSNITSPASIQGWNWDFGDGTGTSTQQNPSYVYTTSGTYAVKLIITTNSGCLDSIVRNVVVDALPLADAGADRTICELDTTILGKPAVVGETYSWNNSVSLTDATAAQPGAFPTVNTRYIVTVTNSNGCTSIDSVDITVTAAPNVDAGPDLTICSRDTIVIGGSPTSTDPVATFLWNNASTLDDPTSPNPRAFPSDTTAYVVTVTDALGCTSTDTMIVNANPLANVDFRVDATCEGDFAAFTDISTLAAGSIVSWSWNFGDGVGTSTLQNPGYQYAAPGTYSVFLEVQTSLGCIDSIRRDVTILPLPVADAGVDLAICIGDTVNLGGNPTGAPGSTYSWAPGIDLSSVLDSNPKAYPTTATIYYLTVTGVNGCVDFDTINVDVNALPIVTAEKDSSLCTNQPVQLSANGALTYAWSPAIYVDDATLANPIARALKSTNFVVKGTDLNGCSATDTVFIDVFNLDFTPMDTAICSGDSVVLAPILQGDTNGISYLWSSSNPNNLLSSVTDSAIKVTANTRQYFTLEIRNALGCVDTDSIYVNMKQPAEVDFDYLNSPRCENSIIEIQNTSTFTDEYIWKLNGKVVSRDRNPDFEINNLVDNTVTLIGTNLTCTDSTTEVIAASGLRNLLQLKDANVFTPNGDGLNDIFDPGFEGEFIGCVDFQIFDRWGEKVFDSNIGQYGWDGVTLRGQPAKVGVYFYIIRIANEEIRGSVYLSR